VNKQIDRIKEITVAEGEASVLDICLSLGLAWFIFDAQIDRFARTESALSSRIAFINALLLAKIMLTAEMLHVAENLKHRPLIYPVIFKSTVFSLILITVSILEETLTAMWHGKAVSIAMDGGSLKGILVVGIIMFWVLMPFFGLKEIGRDIGDGKLYELFFIRRTEYTPQQS